MNSWYDAVERYLTQLSTLTESIDQNLDNLRIEVIESGPLKMEAPLLALISDLKTLEEMVVRREHLLTDPAAPETGFTLREKLLSTRKIEYAALAAEGEEVVKRVQATHQRATAMFVCQFHLTQLTAEMLRTITGDTTSQTYGPKRHDERAGTGGGLFNDAA